MKTIKYLESEIKTLKNDAEVHNKKGEFMESLECLNRVNYLTYCISYLKSNPTGEFINKEIIRLQALIQEKQKIIDDYFNRESFLKMQKSAFIKLKKAKELQYGLPNYQRQLDNLLFLIG